MIRSAQIFGARKQRSRPTPTVAPVTRAIRVALAALVLSAPAVGMAAVPCSYVAASDAIHARHGLTKADADLGAPVDLTVVLSDPPPTSVNPTMATFAAIDNITDLAASGAGSVIGLDVFDAYGASVDNNADISADATVGAYGYFGDVALATGLRVTSEAADVANHGSISATANGDGDYARARAIDSFGASGGSMVSNAGDIQASARSDGSVAHAVGAYSFGYGSASTVDNTGDIHASALADGGWAYATAINSVAYGYSAGRDATVTNSGELSADADAAFAYAITVFNIARGHYANAYVTNADDGHITADASGDYTTATAVINQAVRYGSAVTSNAGDIQATANGTSGGAAFGVANYALGDAATVDNSGSISAMGTSTGIALATGIENDSAIYNANVYNAGSISAIASAGTGMAAAWGVVDKAGLSATVSNDVDGVIDVVATSQDGYALAVGAYALSASVSTLTNYGSISARSTSANGDASAYAAVANATYVGIGVLINGGDLNADASAAAGGHAIATAAFVYADVATIFNDASAAATATSTGGDAIATGAGVYGRFTAIYNYGDLSATAQGGSATAVGADAMGYSGSTFYNASNITAIAEGGDVNATGVSSVGIYVAYATNVGTISADAVGDQAIARGLYNASVFDAITYNEGSISAVANGALAAYGEYEAMAFGAYNLAVYYNSVIDNNGSISASASSMTDISGTTGFLVAKALGAVSVSMYGYGETWVANAGSITASAETSQGYAAAWGAVSRSGLYGISMIDNDGSISAYAHTDIGEADTVGAYVGTIAGIASVVNHGDISAHSRAERGIVDVSVDFSVAYGVRAISLAYGGGEVSVANYGNIEASAAVVGGIGYAYGVRAYGMNASVSNAAGANIIATVDAELFGGASAFGVDVSGVYSVDVVNDGSITAYGHANAYSDSTHGFYGSASAIGIYATAGMQGNVMVVSNGDITALAIAEHSIGFVQGGAGATGIDAYAKYDATVDNTNNITAIAEAEFGNVGAQGVIAGGKYSTHVVNSAGSSIVASASVGSLYGDQQAGIAESFGIQVFTPFGMDYAVTYNAGSIVSHAVVTPDGTQTPLDSYATAFGSWSSAGINSGTVANLGSIEAVASADFGYAAAYGVFLATGYESAVTNAGDIRAGASSIGGNAFAVGSYAFSLHETVTFNCDPTGYYCDFANPIVVVDGGESLLDNSGDIIATASAIGGMGYSYGAVLFGAFAAGITNAGHITAVTDADDAIAVGALANSFYGNATIQNGGLIAAKATGDIASATGLVVHGAYGVVVDNAGTIAAGAYGADATATAVSMDSSGSNVLTNTGTIAAFGDGTRIAISSGSAATASIANRGSITGAILTGDLDDSLDNAVGALWHAVGDSDFGTGDDHVTNHGTLFMDDAAIRLGGYANGNTFDNFGTIVVSGAGNVIDMDNPFPFNNNGVISFLDGAADDALTIVGDFAGQGTLNVDVSGLHQSSDRLYIDGDVIAPTTQTVNVNLLDMPTTPTMHVAVADVLGTSTASDFVLGTVAYGAKGFVSMDFRLNADMDASNARADAFYLGVTVTGLNDMGALATTLAPGAQSLVNAQVGTWRQRMGVVPAAGASGLAPWVRVFSDSGNVNPEAGGNFGPGGNFGFDQSNHGWELGLDARPTEQFAVGALFADSDGTQDLSAGIGSNRLDGKTFGLYGTWMSNGFYLDVSQRWIGIDASLRSSTGTNTTDMSAAAFNVEAGFTAWTVGGLHVVPQAQYTRTRVADISPLESGSSTFVSDGGVSSRGRVGLALDQTFERAGFTWMPYGSINAVREFDGEYAYSVNGGLLGMTRTQGTSAMVELGMGAHKGKLSITGGLNWLDGGAMQNVVGGQVTMRYSW